MTRDAWEKQTLEILDAGCSSWTSKDGLLKGIHPNIGHRALSECLANLVKQGMVRRLERHSARPYFRITDAGRARFDQIKDQGHDQ